LKYSGGFIKPTIIVGADDGTLTEFIVPSQALQFFADILRQL